MLKLVTYNVNGLRARVQQHKSLRSLLDSLDADIICFQETKLRRSELSDDLAIAEGYESFFSFCSSRDKGRNGGYSGVATFCRLQDPVTAGSTALSLATPVAAEDGFSGLLPQPCLDAQAGKRPGVLHQELQNADESNPVNCQDVLRLDVEGRCLVTDHGAFVLFNIYGPCVDPSDPERVSFKHQFYEALAKRWAALLRAGRRVVVAGDLNISPAPIDLCDPKPLHIFMSHPMRKWLRSQLLEGGGCFCDVFRHLHPQRPDAYTCWSQASGAEEFNFGSRIDLILCAGPCLAHEGVAPGGSAHGFGRCDVASADILYEWKRSRAPAELGKARWGLGGSAKRMEGSDHAPVHVTMRIPEHALPTATPPLPPLAARFMPELRGRQQKIVHLLQPCARQPSGEATDEAFPSSSALNPGSKPSHSSRGSAAKAAGEGPRLAQKSLLSFISTKSQERLSSEVKVSVTTAACPSQNNNAILADESFEGNGIKEEPTIAAESFPACTADNGGANANAGHSANAWGALMHRMRGATPLCKGHREPCVHRVVKKAGATQGRGFYVCARAKGPSNNKEARCDHFEWAVVESKKRQRRAS